MKKLLFFTVACALVLCWVSVQAEIPKLINYQGMLTDAGGNPLTDTVSITFRIYNDTTSVAEINKRWEETQSQVEVINGLFNVMLGKVSSLNLDFSEGYWLDITVGTEHLPDRIRLASVGYAYRAERADTAGYAHGGGSGDNDWDVVSNVLYTHGDWGIARFGNTLLGGFAYTHVNLGTACTTGVSGDNNEFCTVGGGRYNTASGFYATVGGGRENIASGGWASVGGGSENVADKGYATVGGGYQNTVIGNYATVGGGSYNVARGWSATVAGGAHNTADTGYATVGGGAYNTAKTTDATVGGGYVNLASGTAATVGGGAYDTASADYATVGGGHTNTASGAYATVAGGRGNTADGDHSFAAGRRAQANHDGTFVWADDRDQSFSSTGDNQFLIRALGGVGIGTSSPSELLEVYSGQAGQTVFLELETSHGGLFEEIGIRFKTPAHTWHFRMDGYNHNNLPDTGSLALRSQTSGEVMVWTPDGNVGIGTTDPNGYKLAVNGTAAKPGGGTWATFSDLRLKETGERYEYGLSEITELEPIRYRYKQDNELGLPSNQQQVGLVAQDVQDVIPDAVSENEQGYLMLNSDPIIWAMLNAIKELKAENEGLKQRIEALEGGR